MHITRPPQNAFVLEEFEARVLFSADSPLAGLVSTDDAVGGAIPHYVQSIDEPWHAEGMTTALASPQSGHSYELAFVDTSLPDVHTLVSDLLAMNSDRRQVEVIALRQDEDGVRQISEALARRAGVDAVHLLSHGADGQIRIGATVLDFDTLVARAGQIRGWGQSLATGADIFLYGCDVARTADGQALVDALARLTGVDVAASDDPTGFAPAGGDWVLEYEHGDTDALGALGFALPVAWQGVLSDQFAVNVTTASAQTTDAAQRGNARSVAMDGAGNYVVVWTSQNQDGQQGGVYARRYAANGVALTGEVLVNQTTAKDQKWAAVASDSAGNFVVTWTQREDAGDQGDIFVRRFDGNGNALTAESQVNTGVGSSRQQNSILAMDAVSGDFVVVWEGEGASDADGIYFRRYNADATAKDVSEQFGNVTDAGNESNPAVAMSASGSFTIAWERGNHIYFQRFNAAGVAQGSVTQVDNGLSTSSGPAIAMNAAGDFTVIYRENVLLTGIWGRGFNADGTQKYTYFRAATGDADDVSIAMASDGAFLVAYEATGDGDGRGVYAREYSTAGTAVGSAFLVNQFITGQQEDPGVALRDINTSVVVWSGNGTGDSNGVFGRQYTADNVAPVNSVPGAQTVREDEVLTFSSGNGNLISIGDADAGTGNLQVTLTAANGLITLGALGSLTFSVGDGTADATMTFTATLAQINTALAGLTFTPTADFSGAASIQIDTDDLGNTGFGGPLADSDSIAITVSAVNDAPSAVADAYTVLQSQTLTVTSGSGVLANDTDPEGDALLVLGATAASNGSVTVASDGSFSYAPTALFTGTDTISYLARNSNDGRTHYWGLDGNATDAIGASHGAVTGATTNSGQFASALTFDGVNDYVLLPDISYSNAFTVSFWFKAPGNAGVGYSYLYSHGNVGLQNSLNIYFLEDSAPALGAGQLRTQLRDSNDADVVDALDVDIAAHGLADNNWHLYTLTATTGSGARVFVDGIERASSVNGGDAFDPAGSVTLGGRNDLDSARFFQGGLDGVQIHDHALQTGEINDVLSAAAATVTFTVTANTAPAITSNGGGASVNLTVAENSTAVTTVTALDSEAPPQTLVYGISGADAGLFTMGSSTGVLTFSSAPDREVALDADLDHVYEVTVSVSDGITTDTQDLHISVTDVNDAAVGAISDTDATADVLDENAANGSLPGITAHAVDADATTNSVTYSLVSDAGGRFAIDGGTGVVTVAGGSLLDYESATTHTITVRATSADGSTSTTDFVISLSPLNDNVPVFTSSAMPGVVENTTQAVVLTATDADAPAQSIGYVISGGADQGLFVVSGGVLRFASAPDFESPQDSNLDNIYLVEVSASDGLGGTTTQVISVAVSDDPEAAPVIAPTILPGPTAQTGGIDAAGDNSTAGVAADPQGEAPPSVTPVVAALLLSAPPMAADEEAVNLLAGADAAQDKGAVARRSPVILMTSGQGSAWTRPRFAPVADGEGALLGAGWGGTATTTLSADALRSSLSGARWLGQLQFLRDQLEQDMRLEGVMIGTTAFVSGGLSVGYVIWLVRGGLLVSTLLSALPAWHSIDPLPVLGQRGDDDDGTGRKDAVENLFERARKVWRGGAAEVGGTR